MVVQKGFHDLVVSTYGRGLYVLDDITPLEQQAKGNADAAVVLYEPRSAYRWVRAAQATLNYSLKSAPRDPARIEILDAQGAIVRTLEAKSRAGLNRQTWDMRYESPRVVALRTEAPENPHIWEEPRFRGADSRPVTHWGIRPAEIGPIVAPGQYTVRLTVDGHSVTQPLTVLRDARAPGSEADIQLSVKTLLRIREDINHAADSINDLEWLRRQLEVVTAMLRPARAVEADPAPLAEEGDDYDQDPALAPPRTRSPAEQAQRTELLAAAESLAKKLQAVESKLVSRSLQNSDDKYFVEPYGLYLNLMWFNAEVGTGGGDVAGSADFAPTETQMGLLQGFETEAASIDAEYRKVLADDLSSFNRLLADGHYAPLVGPATTH